jgi:hypothetical protein
VNQVVARSSGLVIADEAQYGSIPDPDPSTRSHEPIPPSRD